MDVIEVLKAKTEGMPDEVVITLTTQQGRAILDQLEAERQLADAVCRDIRIQANDLKSAQTVNMVLRAELAELKAEQVPVALTVWYGSMPESNGKENWTAIIHRKGDCISEGITIDRSEYPERVRYEADRMRCLIGEMQGEPDILTYDANKRSDYACPVTVPQKPVVLPPLRARDDYESRLGNGDIGPYNHGHLEGWNAAIEAAGGIVKDGE